MNFPRLSTQLVHAGEPRPRIEGALCTPIFQSATFQYRGENDYDALVYARLNNTPNHLALHHKLAAIESTQAALVAASGMAAISTTLLSLLGQGQHLLAQNCLYGGTHSFVCEDLPQYGIDHTFVDGQSPDRWSAALRPSTRIFYVEAMSNPLLQVPELEAVVAFCRDNGLLSVIDSTFASPVNFRPAEMGFDIVLHSATKYLNGHSDIVAGVVAGSQIQVDVIRHRLNHLGGSLDAHACFLLQRGLKTLKLRVEQQNHTALTLAHWLEQQPQCQQVNYPGLTSHPAYAQASRWFSGFGGVLSFELKGELNKTLGFLEALRIPVQAPSLGGVETLITRPCTTSHSGLTAEERRASGISDKLVRLAVGIEDAEDLLEDFGQALAQS